MSAPHTRPIRIAARAVLVHEGKLLLVNAYRGRADLWAAPGGGARLHDSLPDTLIREVHEETGLAISIGAPCLVNEFHDPDHGFHQVEIFFRATLTGGVPGAAWTDPEGVVTRRKWVTPADAARLLVRPRALLEIAWDETAPARYDPLERVIP